MINTMKSLLALCLFYSAASVSTAETPIKHTSFRPGEIWTDNNGAHINAHGGGILYDKGTYYWYGEHKVEGDAGNYAQVGVHCYSSKDLYNWKDEGIALKVVEGDHSHPIAKGCILERPKVVYNKKTKKFVMWMHIDSPDYSKAEAGVAIADSPTGPFKYLDGFRPNGTMSRDQTVFVDDDGTAYQFSSSEENQTMHINRLTEDYTKPDGKYVRRFVGMAREAPAVFKHGNKYYMLSSGCTGWDPNSAELAVADSIIGEWTVLGDPCTGPDAEKTFYGQSTFVIPVQGKKNAFIACFDMWKKKDLQDSRYIWLPMMIDKQTNKITIPWHAEWNLDVFKKK